MITVIAVVIRHETNVAGLVTTAFVGGCAACGKILAKVTNILRWQELMGRSAAISRLVAVHRRS